MRKWRKKRNRPKKRGIKRMTRKTAEMEKIRKRERGGGERKEERRE